MKICFATHNENKLREVKQILGSGFDIVGLNDIGCTEEIPETGVTLDENSQLKADFVYQNFGVNCFADDTGLEVNSLQGAPGVYSARYAGDQKNNQDNISLLLTNLEDQTDRSARFRTVVTLIIDGAVHQVDGTVNGQITEQKSGNEGFGYDPIFTPDGYDCTFAEMSAEGKNAISHRGRAINALQQFLASFATKGS